MTEPAVAPTEAELEALTREQLHDAYGVDVGLKADMIAAILNPAPEPSPEAAAAADDGKVILVAGMTGDSHFDPETELTIVGGEGTEVPSSVADGIVERAAASHISIYRKA